MYFGRPADFLTLTVGYPQAWPTLTGLLLVNLGTPDAPTTPAVRRYLHEFLSDPRVLDIGPINRALLLHLIILRTRPAKSAHAYRQIWDAERGSPLYPQHAASSTSTTNARVMELAAAEWDVAAIDLVPAFHADAAFLDAWAAVARPALAEARADHVLFSFHGLPERQIKKSGDAQCLSAGCCDRDPGPSRCYRSQCYATARALVARLGVADHTVCFQSRLGRTPWITPHTDVVLDELAGKGVKRLAVMCPAFVADCLETLEEIGLRARAQFKAAGGEELVLVPSLNATPK